MLICDLDSQRAFVPLLSKDLDSFIDEKQDKEYNAILQEVFNIVRGRAFKREVTEHFETN